MPRPNFALFLVILLEGYVVLACELLAIRLLIPHVGSGVEVVAIIISGVLLPLAYGYYCGGRRYHDAVATSASRSIRKWLLKNLISAMAILTFGLSFVFLELFFALLNDLGIKHFLLQTSIYTAVFLVYPVFLLAQTVPLISNYFKQAQLSRITGRMLFFSTIGSFLGSVVSTIIFMHWIGVHMTCAVTICLLTLSIILLSRRGLHYDHLLAGLFAMIAIAVNNPAFQHRIKVYSDSAYNTASVYDHAEENRKDLYLNNSRSSRYSSDPKQRFSYIRFIEESIINPMPADGHILVLGAGGFTLGIDDHQRDYVFVDIDAALKQVAEDHLLPSKLAANKHFIAESARQFLNQTDQLFDAIIVDVFSNQQSIPMETTTVEFWQSVQTHLRPSGVVAANIIMSPLYVDRFSVRIANTFSAVFPSHIRQLVEPVNFWSARADLPNVLFIYKHSAHSQDRTIYTDDLNSHSMDRFITH